MFIHIIRIGPRIWATSSITEAIFFAKTFNIKTETIETSWSPFDFGPVKIQNLNNF